jgi:hypothetical protein
MKNGLRKKHFCGGDNVSVVVKKWLLKTDSNFYERRVEALVYWWRKYVQSDGEYVGKISLNT